MDGAAAAPTEREEGKADGSKVTVAQVGCFVSVSYTHLTLPTKA